MEEVICIACGRNCTEEELQFVLTEDGPVCVLCLEHDEGEGDEPEPEDNDWEEPYDY